MQNTTAQLTKRYIKISPKKKNKHKKQTQKKNRSKHSVPSHLDNACRTYGIPVNKDRMTEGGHGALKDSKYTALLLQQMWQQEFNINTNNNTNRFFKTKS